MSLIKVADLNKSELAAFVKLDEGRYVLAKKLQSYDWDTGSVWKLVKDSSGQLAIAREEEERNQAPEVPTGILEDRCKSCGAALEQISSNGSNISVCAHCNPSLKTSLNKTAALNEELTEENRTPVPGNFTVQANGYFTGRLLPLVYSWIDSGLTDISKEGMLKQIDAQMERGEISQIDCGMLKENVDLLTSYAADYVNPPDLIETEFAQAQYKESKPKEEPKVLNSTGADSKIAFLLRNKPKSMPVAVFTSLFQKIKAEKKS